MQFLPQMAASIHAQKSSLQNRPVDDVVYQVVTLGAILLVLGTLWVF